MNQTTVIPFKRRPDPNAAVIDRIKGLPAKPGTPESDNDPSYPFVKEKP